MRKTVVREMTLGAPGGEPDQTRGSVSKSNEAGTDSVGKTT